MQKVINKNRIFWLFRDGQKEPFVKVRTLSSGKETHDKIKCEYTENKKTIEVPSHRLISDAEYKDLCKKKGTVSFKEGDYIINKNGQHPSAVKRVFIGRAYPNNCYDEFNIFYELDVFIDGRTSHETRWRVYDSIDNKYVKISEKKYEELIQVYYISYAKEEPEIKRLSPFMMQMRQYQGMCALQEEPDKLGTEKVYGSSNLKEKLRRLTSKGIPCRDIQVIKGGDIVKFLAKHDVEIDIL